jgi:Flp pilus assembly protein TadB
MKSMDQVAVLRGSVRASDAERARAVAALRRHYAVGRLETDELEQRVEAAYAARWRYELRSLLRDLPWEPPIDRARLTSGLDRFQRALLRFHVACWLVFNTIVLAFWAWTGGHSALPIFAIVVTTLLLAWHARASRSLSRRLAGEAPRALPRRRLV